jgi:hypothetical protein
LLPRAAPISGAILRLSYSVSGTGTNMSAR